MPKSQGRSVLSLALLVLGTACQSLIEPREVVPVEFFYGIHRLQTEPAFLVDTQADAVIIRGYLLTPCQPYNASASAEVVGATLVLRVIGKATEECPQDVVSSVGYQATLRANLSVTSCHSSTSNGTLLGRCMFSGSDSEVKSLPFGDPRVALGA